MASCPFLFCPRSFRYPRQSRRLRGRNRPWGKAVSPAVCRARFGPQVATAAALRPPPDGTRAFPGTGGCKDALVTVTQRGLRRRHIHRARLAIGPVCLWGAQHRDGAGGSDTHWSLRSRSGSENRERMVGIGRKWGSCRNNRGSIWPGSEKDGGLRGDCCGRGDGGLRVYRRQWRADPWIVPEKRTIVQVLETIPRLGPRRTPGSGATKCGKAAALAEFLAEFLAGVLVRVLANAGTMTGPGRPLPAAQAARMPFGGEQNRRTDHPARHRCFGKGAGVPLRSLLFFLGQILRGSGGSAPGTPRLRDRCGKAGVTLWRQHHSCARKTAPQCRRAWPRLWHSRNNPAG